MTVKVLLKDIMKRETTSPVRELINEGIIDCGSLNGRRKRIP